MDSQHEVDVRQPPPHSRWRLRRDLRKVMHEWDRVLIEVRRLRSAGSWSERIAGDWTYQALRSALETPEEVEVPSPAVQFANRVRRPVTVLVAVMLCWALFPLFDATSTSSSTSTATAAVLAGVAAGFGAAVVLVALLFTTSLSFAPAPTLPPVVRAALPLALGIVLGLTIGASRQAAESTTATLIRVLLVLTGCLVVVSVQLLTQNMPRRPSLRGMELSTRPVERRAKRAMARQRAYAQVYAQAVEGCFVVVEALPFGPDRDGLLAELRGLSGTTSPQPGATPVVSPTALLPLARPAEAAVSGLRSRHPSMLQHLIETHKD